MKPLRRLNYYIPLLLVFPSLTVLESTTVVVGTSDVVPSFTKSQHLPAFNNFYPAVSDLIVNSAVSFADLDSQEESDAGGTSSGGRGVIPRATESKPAVPLKKAFIPTNLEKILPPNPDIPATDLMRISLEVLPYLVETFNIPVSTRQLGFKTVDQCQESKSKDGSSVRKGCYLAIFLCDDAYRGECFWTFKRQCSCGISGLLKFYECIIQVETLRLPEAVTNFSPVTRDYFSQLPSEVYVPVGECRVALWAWAFTVLSTLITCAVFTLAVAHVIVRRTF